MQLEKESLCFSSFKFVVRLNHQTFDQSVILCYVSDIPSKKDWIFHCKVFFFINVSLAPIQTRPLIIQVNQQVNKQEGLSINQFPIVSAFKAFHWPWLHRPYYLLIKKIKTFRNSISFFQIIPTKQRFWTIFSELRSLFIHCPKNNSSIQTFKTKTNVFSIK